MALSDRRGTQQRSARHYRCPANRSGTLTAAKRRDCGEHARVSDLAAVPICCPHSSNAPDQRCECSDERRRLAAAHGVQIGDHCAKNKLPSFDRRGQHRHRKDRGARDFYPARADKMCRWDMNMIHGPFMINISSSTSVIMFPFLYTRRCRESRA